jgi:CheY-like chemotaxis protein
LTSRFQPIYPKVPHTLLLADDSVTIQRVIELTFADEDVRVVAVSDGDQAIAMLDQTPPDIVLADVGMPGLNGYEIARHMKNSPRLAHIPIVLLTGAFEPIDQARASELGCDGVLAKPFEPQLVIARVKELLARSTQVSSIDPELSPLPAAEPSWIPSFGDRPQTSDAAPADVGHYFDRLDVAFSNLASGAPPLQGPGVPAAPPVTDAIDWFGAPPPAVQEPLSDRWDIRPSGPAQEAPAQPAPVAPTLPPLADAFAALLIAEQSAPAPSTPPVWPATTGSSTAVPDDIVEQVTERVLAQLSDRVVRETVREIVAAVAERIVREEIERIKKAME